MDSILKHIGAAYQVARDLYSGNLRYTVSTVTVGTTPVLVAANDPERVVLTLINLSTQNMYVAPDNQVSASRNITLAGNGGLISVNAREDGILSAIEWYALANLASQTLYRIDVRRDTGL